jgi:crossover junction endodeoxyribonuclease RuvC
VTQVVGVDPGKTGAVVVIDTENLTASVFDMPIIPIGNGKRTEVDSFALYHLLDQFEDITHAGMEDVWSNPNDGHVGAFSFGDSVGTIKGVLSAYVSSPIIRVRPQVWKKTMRVTADKATSIARAKELMPCITPKLTLKKHDGRAEAALIALYTVFNLGYRLPKPLTLREETNEEVEDQK